MASRTNKQGIAKKKAVQAKQASRLKGAKRFNYPKRNISLEMAMSEGFVHAVKNPAGNTWHWFYRGRKVCWETRVRVDPDGYRYNRTPNGGQNIIQVFSSGFVRRKLKKQRK
jgi:hypothetical protein